MPNSALPRPWTKAVGPVSWGASAGGAGVGRFRDAFESRMRPGGKACARYGRPAPPEAVAVAEAALGLPLPRPLRELYADFDGLWYDPTCDVPPDDDTEWYEVLPLRLLPTARGMLIRLYGGSAEPGYADFAEQLGRCVAFCLPEHGASFKFMTDQRAWGIAPGRVGGWSHDGGAYDSSGTLAAWLAEIGRMRSRAQ